MSDEDQTKMYRLELNEQHIHTILAALYVYKGTLPQDTAAPGYPMSPQIAADIAVGGDIGSPHCRAMTHAEVADLNDLICEQAWAPG